MGRTIVVGDIHGCFDELQDLLSLAEVTTDDRVVTVGDLTCKGEQSREVLELFMEDARFSAVIGNHDRALLRFWRGEEMSLKSSQEQTRQQLEPERERYFAYLNKLPYYLDLGSHLIVHAGVRPGAPLSAQAEDDLTELRTLGPDRTNRDGTPWYQIYDGAQIVLFGHWPAPTPRIGPRAVGLDTGCVYGFHLTAYAIESDKFFCVPARKAYAQPR